MNEVVPTCSHCGCRYAPEHPCTCSVPPPPDLDAPPPPPKKPKIKNPPPDSYNSIYEISEIKDRVIDDEYKNLPLDVFIEHSGVDHWPDAIEDEEDIQFKLPRTVPEPSSYDDFMESFSFGGRGWAEKPAEVLSGIQKAMLRRESITTSHEAPIRPNWKEVARYNSGQSVTVVQRDEKLKCTRTRVDKEWHPKWHPWGHFVKSSAYTYMIDDDHRKWSSQKMMCIVLKRIHDIKESEE